VMTTGRVVEHDGAAGSYLLPASHAAWLTRAAGMDNLAAGMQYIGLLALVEDQIVDCFRHGGGVPYSAFPRFQAVMAEDSGAVRDATLIDVTLPLVPGLTDRLSAGRAFCYRETASWSLQDLPSGASVPCSRGPPWISAPGKSSRSHRQRAPPSRPSASRTKPGRRPSPAPLRHQASPPNHKDSNRPHRQRSPAPLPRLPRRLSRSRTWSTRRPLKHK
jgi:hypothetical protein